METRVKWSIYVIPINLNGLKSTKNLLWIVQGKECMHKMTVFLQLEAPLHPSVYLQ